MITVESELPLLNQSLRRYQEVTKKSVEQILLKQGTKLSFALSQRLRGLMPGKGAIRAERIEALKSGGGVYVRPAVKRQVMEKLGARQEIEGRGFVFGKGRRSRKSTLRKGRRMNLQALMVQRELNLRESGRGFLGFSARFKGLGILKPGARKRWLDRTSRLLAEAGLSINTNNGVLELAWDKGPSARHAAEGLLKPKAQEAIATAIREVRLDIARHIGDDLAKDARAAFKK